MVSSASFQKFNGKVHGVNAEFEGKQFSVGFFDLKHLRLKYAENTGLNCLSLFLLQVNWNFRMNI